MAKGVRCSERGTCGKAAVEKVYRSSGVERGEGATRRRETDDRVHYIGGSMKDWAGLNGFGFHDAVGSGTMLLGSEDNPLTHSPDPHP